MDYKAQIDRGIELLMLCGNLQCQNDGVDRVLPLGTGKGSVLDEFASDLSVAVSCMSSLYKLIPQMLSLGALGRKLATEGKLSVDYGEDYSTAALAYVLREYGVSGHPDANLAASECSGQRVSDKGGSTDGGSGS
ncbi:MULTISPECIES: hypothetical protein [Burkholderia]|uniref:Uncharacterized protein n=2 Tax=Burkholderia cepacia complex TaxID=87882 RepID=A0AAP1YDM2_9BURK|nr:MULTISPECIES: hypothetical protein [Burkholderia]MBK1901997.1 hypothetical protein [Burkholderia contaminans]MBK1910280.1 hypothetical protein [Burkholderia contaminans]MBK1923739.1 hypothetical protein [Burkholderia contaminans]MBK1931951.1 hypothetical protein [Burkholderia contaminans]MBK1939200.1 hypothetical protein [Burkholderia contaminans]